MNDQDTIRQDIIASGRRLLARDLAWGCSGNISQRTGENAFLITASGTDLGALSDGDLTMCRVSSAQHQGPTPSGAPSRETGLHRAIYRTLPAVQAVVHTSPFYTTLVACCHIPLRTDLFPEAMAYLGQVGWVAYHHPGSQTLAKAVAAQAAENLALMLENHGVVAVGQSLDEVGLRIETLEFLCRMEVAARGSGLALHYLGAEAAQAFSTQYQAQQSHEQEINPC